MHGFVRIVEYLTSGIQDLFLNGTNFSGVMAEEQAALFNSFVVSVAASVASLMVGGLIQGFFNLFGAVFSPRSSKRVRK